MQTSEKIIFIRELIGNVQKDILSQVGKMPDSWDGIELRRYIADKFEEANIKRTMTPQRKREYNNTIIVNGMH
jgi:hypothetical protein